MPSWMKGKPAKPPAKPKKVDLMHVIAVNHDFETRGPLNSSQLYLKANLPKQSFDRWGQPLPLSTVMQERMDRMVAVIVNPMERGRQLLLSGTLDTLETNALKDGCPEAYAALQIQALKEMADAGPPIADWAEKTLSVFFGRDAAMVYAQDQEDGQPDSQKRFAGKAPPPNPADLSQRGLTH